MSSKYLLLIDEIKLNVFSFISYAGATALKIRRDFSGSVASGPQEREMQGIQDKSLFKGVLRENQMRQHDTWMSVAYDPGPKGESGSLA